ncbi:hypothetical protein BSL78_26827 [Apostichopus japonicus]|uniref:EGF-like domain-containing protein n=1 Tax=Stichopus japonicus TaxID=307972 RepID=A0A2G8JKW1_STIJA|nr:hypothetical protein BSL78_26827 [Apostichopus japonicus]
MHSDVTQQSLGGDNGGDEIGTSMDCPLVIPARIAFFVTHISLDVLFDEDLNDRTSNAFMNLQEEICEEITNIMLGNTSTLRAVFLGCYVNSFMNGSVIADIVTEYSTEITVVAADVTKMLGGLKSTGLNLTITWNITSEVFQLQHCSTGNNVCHENVSTCRDIKEMNGYECSCKDGFIDQDSVPGMSALKKCGVTLLSRWDFVDQGAVGGRYATVVGLALAVLFVVIILLSCIILLAKRIVKTKAEMTMDIPLSELPVHLTSKRRLTDFVPYPAGAKGTDEVDGYPTPDYPADGYADENGRKVKSRVMGDPVENVSYIPFILLQAGTREEAIIGLAKLHADRSQSLTFIFNVHDYELSIVNNSVTGRHTLILE